MCLGKWVGFPEWELQCPYIFGLLHHFFSCGLLACIFPKGMPKEVRTQHGALQPVGNQS